MKKTKYHLGEVLVNYDRLRKPLSSMQRESFKGEYPYYGAQGIIDYVAEYRCDGEYLLIAEDGENLSSRNEPIAQIATGRFWVNNHAHIVRNNELSDMQYICYLLNSLDIAGYVTGSAQPKLSQANLNKIVINLPSLPFQQKIASILSTYDTLIENNTKRIRLLEQMAENLYKEWFVRFRFPGHENVEMDNGLPKNWEKVTLDTILSKITTGLNPRKNFVLGQGENYYVTIKNMGNNNVYLDEKCDKVDDDALLKINKRSDLRTGDILFSGIGTIGRVYLINIPTHNWNVSESVFTMRVNDKASKEFLYLLLLSDRLQNYCQQHAQGVAQPGIRMAELKSFRFLLPSKDIITKFTEKVSGLLYSIDIIRKQNQLLIRQRDLLLPRLMSGKLEVKP